MHNSRVTPCTPWSALLFCTGCSKPWHVGPSFSAVGNAHSPAASPHLLQRPLPSCCLLSRGCGLAPSRQQALLKLTLSLQRAQQGPINHSRLPAMLLLLLRSWGPGAAALRCAVQRHQRHVPHHLHQHCAMQRHQWHAFRTCSRACCACSASEALTLAAALAAPSCASRASFCSSRLSFSCAASEPGGAISRPGGAAAGDSVLCMAWAGHQRQLLLAGRHQAQSAGGTTRRSAWQAWRLAHLQCSVPGLGCLSKAGGLFLGCVQLPLQLCHLLGRRKQQGGA